MKRVSSLGSGLWSEDVISVTGSRFGSGLWMDDVISVTGSSLGQGSGEWMSYQ